MIPVMIYYPVPLYKQEAFSNYVNGDFKIANIEHLCNTVFSLPIHTEVENSNQEFIINKVKEFFIFFLIIEWKQKIISFMKVHMLMSLV